MARIVILIVYSATYSLASAAVVTGMAKEMKRLIFSRKAASL